MWHRSRPNRHEKCGPDPEPTARALDAGVVEAARAVVEGRVVEQLWEQGGPVPAWVWLNTLAHRRADELADAVAIACNQPGDRWAEALVDIADDLRRIPAAATARIRAELFVPAELETLAGTSRPDGPSQLVRAVHHHVDIDIRPAVTPAANPSPPSSDRSEVTGGLQTTDTANKNEPDHPAG